MSAPYAARMLGQILLLLLAGGQVSAQPVDSFSPHSAEVSLSRGLAQLESGQYEDALDSLNQALQSNRASHGLYNPGQFSYIESLLEASLLRGDQAGFLKHVAYFEWLLYRIHGEQPSQMADGLSRLAAWHLAAATGFVNEQSPWHLIQARQTNWKLVTLIERYHGRNDARLPPILYSIVLSHYYQVNATQRRWLTGFEFRSEGPVVSNGWAFMHSESVRRSYQVGVELLQRIAAIHQASGNQQAAALAIVQLADWQLLFDYRGLAAQHYLQARDKLVEAGYDAETLDEYFSRIVLLPEPRLLSEIPVNAEGDLNRLDFVSWTTLVPGVPRPADHPVRVGAPPGLWPPSLQFDLKVESGTIRFNLDEESSQVLQSNSLSSGQESGNLFRQRILRDLSAFRFRPAVPLSGSLENWETDRAMRVDYHFVPSEQLSAQSVE